MQDDETYGDQGSDEAGPPLSVFQDALRCLQAFDNLYYLERAAEVIVKARSMHEELEVISDEVRYSEILDYFSICLADTLIALSNLAL